MVMAKALDAITLAVRTNAPFPGDDQLKRPFSPATTTQLFGVNEIIVGYRNVEIEILIEAHSLQYHIRASKNGRALDDAALKKLLNYFHEWFPANLTSIKEFQLVVQNEYYYPYFGVIVGTYKAMNDCDLVFTYCDKQTPSQMCFHRRLESIAVFYVEAITKIVISPLWSFLYVYRKATNFYFPIGFISIIKYRNVVTVSQVFLFPNFQGMGVGHVMLECVYDMCGQDETCVYIDVEKPCLSFQALRDRFDMDKLHRHHFDFHTTPYETFHSQVRRYLKLTDEQILHLFRGMEYVKADNVLARRRVLRTIKLEVMEHVLPYGNIPKRPVIREYLNKVTLYRRIKKHYSTLMKPRITSRTAKGSSSC